MNDRRMAALGFVMVILALGAFLAMVWASLPRLNPGAPSLGLFIERSVR